MIPTDWREVPGGWEVGEGVVDRVLLPGIAGEVREFVRLVPHRGPGAVRILRLPEADLDHLPAIARAVAPFLPDHPVDLLGASFGALVARALDPARLRTLTTIGMLPARSAAADRAGWVARLLPLLPRPAYEAWYGRRAEAAWAEDGADPELLSSVRLPPRGVLAARLRAIHRWEIPDRPRVPTTMLWGATDPFARWDVATVEALGAQALVVPGGHRPHLSHPSEVARWWNRPTPGTAPASTRPAR